MVVLVVDDSMLIRQKMKHIMESLGHTVVLATNGEEAIGLYINKNPDLVTMDAIMPLGDGITALKDILLINPNAKIVMVTSSGLEDLVIQSIHAGAIGYILKPLTIDKIKKVIEDTFDESFLKDDIKSNDNFEKNLFNDMET